MAGIKALVLLAFAAVSGCTLLVLGCALPMFNVWWPLFAAVFYVLAPIPLMVARRMGGGDDLSGSSACVELALFITTGIVVSAFALPVVLAHTNAIDPWAAALTALGNTVCFLTILAYFYVHRDDDGDFGGTSMF